MHLDGEFLKPRSEGLPGLLPSLFADKTSVSGRNLKYRIATVPKKIELNDNGTHYDWETGVRVAVY